MGISDNYRTKTAISEPKCERFIALWISSKVIFHPFRAMADLGVKSPRIRAETLKNMVCFHLRVNSWNIPPGLFEFARIYAILNWSPARLLDHIKQLFGEQEHDYAVKTFQCLL